MAFTPKQFGLVLAGIAVLLLIILSWVKVNIDRQTVFLCEEVAKDPALTMEDCPAHSSNTSWLLMGAFGITFLILGSGIYLLFFSAERSGKPAVRKSDLGKLGAEERKICELLQQNQGSMYQSDLIKETGFSKVKITRLLDRMEPLGIIERKRRGMTNIIVLQ